MFDHVSYWRACKHHQCRGLQSWPICFQSIAHLPKVTIPRWCIADFKKNYLYCLLFSKAILISWWPLDDYFLIQSYNFYHLLENLSCQAKQNKTKNSIEYSVWFPAFEILFLEPNVVKTSMYCYIHNYLPTRKLGTEFYGKQFCHWILNCHRLSIFFFIFGKQVKNCE